MRVRAALLAMSLTSLGAQAAYDQHPKFEQFTQELHSEYGISADTARHWLSQAERMDSVLEAISRPAERRLEWHEYRKIFLTDSRIKQGKQFLQTYAKELEAAQQKYGVDPAIIAAVIGVETYYGQRQGSYRVLDSLATLAFDYPKRPLFWRELKAFFALAEKEQLDLASIKGSYAGAMGYGQFIPTSYLSYAVDADHDGKRDLWNNPQDAIASVANYFKRHGWRAGELITVPVTDVKKVPADMINSKLKPRFSAGEFRALGVTIDDQVADNADATLMQLEAQQGTEYWLGAHNFYVITRYNHSRLYAMAVFQLSEALQ
ncbi:lytic murein transglycosylase B [Bacterioplanes sanyensis]|uniref:Lytic murein transglycosylase B n=1 Tax=Bacterioplanes sanyensis TaxID=1249553 RepID=A0A222FNY4_9GAMM|nr:lytic murein transglycosylase B [Bacterioplanes sanyensis]ASP40735.1 lytic murein transglycosylase B [Bacterioplanes sanyensis]